VEIKRDILWRVYLSFIGVVLLSFCVLGRAFYIQKVQGNHWRSLSDSMHQKYVEMDAERGTIYSEDGQMLSTSIPFYDIYMDLGAEGLHDKKGKNFRNNIDSFCIVCAHLFKDKSSAEYKHALTFAYKQEDRYYLLKKGLSFEQYKEFRTFPLVRLGRNKSGVIVEERSKRLNPFGMLGRRTIGLARLNAQSVGLERTYDSMLTGTNGKRLVRYISGGTPVPVEGYEIESENGKDIITTLDVHIQDIVESALMKMMVESESEHGTCIVMETKTGKIKAIANLGRTANGSYDETLNYALQTTEPGSTIKLATLLAVLDHGSSRINDLVNVGSTGSAYVGVRTVNDAERAPKPVLTVKECFAHSSNVGMSMVAYKAFAEQPDIYLNYLRKFHLDKRTGIDLVGEDAPRLPRIKRNKEGLHAMITASFGYAIEVSPLHTLMLYNAVANNGRMMKPYLVNEIKNNGVSVKQVEPTLLTDNFARPEVIAASKDAMVAVTTIGTAKDVFKDFPYPVAGKTGTAHVAGAGLNYGDGVYQASFVGFFPVDKPQYTCIVVIKTKPHAPIHFGGQLAAPVFKEVATELFAQYIQRPKVDNGITADSSNYVYAGYKTGMMQVLKDLGVVYRDSSKLSTKWSEVHNVNFKPVLKSEAVSVSVMPDVLHMTLRDALYACESMELKVVTKGKGKVVAQDIQPGTTIGKNKNVTLLLN
jgi:cell division protein FtsI (penicillin-binding protein 3)